MSKKLGLIVPHDYKLLSIAAILEVFETTNKLSSGNEKPFEIMIFQSKEQNDEGNLFGYVSNVIETSNIILDLILIPAFTTDNMSEMIKKNKNFIPWLQKQHQAGAELASFCTGAFFVCGFWFVKRKTGYHTC
ncbi:type 1 glutamine amidotransferase family protein [Flavobacterium sp. CGRL2]